MTNKEMMEKMMNTLENLDKRITALEKSSKKTSEKKPEKSEKKSSEKTSSEKREYEPTYIGVEWSKGEINFSLCNSEFEECYIGSKAAFYVKNTIARTFLKENGMKNTKNNGVWTSTMSKADWDKLLKHEFHVKGTKGCFAIPVEDGNSYYEKAKSGKVEYNRSKEAKKFR